MKKMILPFIALLFTTASASAQCDMQISEIAVQYGQKSDSLSQPTLVGTLFAGSIHKGAQGRIGPFTEDVYLYINNGSLHSGWFQEAFALDYDCNFKSHTLLYSE